MIEIMDTFIISGWFDLKFLVAILSLLIYGEMRALEKIFGQRDNNVLNMDEVINKCNNACMECLSCKYNKNPQFNLVLQNLFNSGKTLSDIKWRDVNLYCGLNKDI